MILAHEEVTPIYNKGVIYLEKNNFKKAIQYLKKAYDIYPCMEVCNNLGVAYRAVGQDAMMWKYYKEALNAPSLLGTPDAIMVQVLNNLGLAYYMYGDDVAALDCYRKAIRIDPKAWDCWWNSSTAWLRIASTSGDLEDFAHGWEMYKARFLKAKPVKMKNMKENLMYWDTVSSGSSIVVLVEQGIGDNLMFARYLDRLSEKFERVYVQCDNNLGEVFELAGYHTVRDASECDATVAYPMCSLGECFPDVTRNYNWLEGKYGAHDFGPGKHIGIVFSGNSTHANDAYRSTTVGRFSRFAKYGKLYCLQPDFKGSRDVVGLQPRTWKETAEYINGLDLVIGVDTSSMHMVGALGREGWLIQPYKETDFRWGTVNTSVGSSVWYPNIRVFNNPQSWDVVFDRIEKCLQ
jgi:tetratricopeptide (TPR) repeat protein